MCRECERLEKERDRWQKEFMMCDQVLKEFGKDLNITKNILKNMAKQHKYLLRTSKNPYQEIIQSMALHAYQDAIEELEFLAKHFKEDKQEIKRKERKVRSA